MQDNAELCENRALLRRKDSQLEDKNRELLALKETAHSQLKAKDREILVLRQTTDTQLDSKERQILSLKEAAETVAAMEADSAEKVRELLAAKEAAVAEGSSLRVQVQASKALVTDTEMVMAKLKVTVLND